MIRTDYLTSYSFFATGYKKEQYDAICFSHLFGYIEDSDNFEEDTTVILKMNKDVAINEDKRNNFILTNEEFLYYMKFLKQLFNYEYEVLKEDGYNIDLKITHNDKLYGLKHLCIFLRFLYEDNMNYALKDALRMHLAGMYTDIDIITLTHVCYINMYADRTVHYISDSKGMFIVDINELKDLFYSEFGSKYIFDSILKKKDVVFKEMDDNLLFKGAVVEYDDIDIEEDPVYYNHSQESFNKRLCYYKKTIDSLNNKKQ